MPRLRYRWPRPVDPRAYETISRACDLIMNISADERRRGAQRLYRIIIL